MACRRSRAELLGVLLPAPAISQGVSLGNRGKQLGIVKLIPKASGVDTVEHSSYDSATPFSHGETGSMKAVLVVLLASHKSRRPWAMKSGPLSLRM